MNRIEQNYDALIEDEVFTPEVSVGGITGAEPEALPVDVPPKPMADVAPGQAGMEQTPSASRVAEMKPYEPTVRQQLSDFLRAGFEGIGVDRAKARQNAEALIGGPNSPLPLEMGIADFIPFLGTGLQTQESYRMGGEAIESAKRGELGTAALQAGGAALGLIPGAAGTYKYGKPIVEDLAAKAKAGELPVGLSVQPVTEAKAAEMLAAKGVQQPAAPVIDLQPGANVTEGNKIGVESALRVKVDTAAIELPEKPLLLLATNEKNAAKQIDNIDQVFNQYPPTELTQDSWTKMMSYAFSSDEVPVPPYAIIKASQSPDGLAAPLRQLTQGQIDDASAGFRNAAQFKDLYTAGKADVVTTGKLFLWSFLSRGVSPYVQEGLFMDAIEGIEPFLRKAAAGQFGEKELEQYLAWTATIAGKGSGQPGAGASHNLNAFGKNFLMKLSRVGDDGTTGLQKIHTMMADPNMTGPQIRREFAKIGTGVGIDNKVVSFTLLVSGRNDVLVLDRVQLRNLWDDGRFADKNLWDGRSVKRMVKQQDGTLKEKSAQIAGTALSEITYGAKGLLVYEALERALADRIKEAYRLVGREGDASLGRYHWETWVAASQQEASHGTIDAIMREAGGAKNPFKGVTAKQGEYGAYEYGAKYGSDESGKYFLYDTSDGKTFRFTVPQFRDMLDAMKNPKTGVVPKGFLVSKSGNAPWFTRPEVDRSKLDELITARGTPVGAAPGGKQPVSADGKGAAAAGTRPGRRAPARGRVTSKPKGAQ